MLPSLGATGLIFTGQILYPTGFQISLNYLMELDGKLISNSARAYVGWEEGSMERRRRISLVPGQRKPGRAQTKFEDTDPQTDCWVEIISEGQVSPCFSDEQTEIPMETYLFGNSFDPQTDCRVEILRSGSDGRKRSHK